MHEDQVIGTSQLESRDPKQHLSDVCRVLVSDEINILVQVCLSNCVKGVMPVEIVETVEWTEVEK